MTHQAERLRPDQLKTLREQTPLAYLPLGLLEWHGPHNPIGLDGVKAHALCVRAAQQAGGVVFPTVYYGPPPASNCLEIDHYDPAYAEAYGLPDENFTTDKFNFGTRLSQWHLFDTVLDQALRQIARLGFKAIIVLAGHYPLANAYVPVSAFSRQHQIPVWIGHEGQLFDPPEGDHAAQWETSLTMALEPDTVDPTRFTPPGADNPPGVFGEPIGDITPELAQENLDRTIAALIARANELLS
ncbi:MAG: hypothetical protein CMJ49_14635 [Planctomycetaceae bacterium]|nr:hypothetical protein [Planctomycetaceae bacterium]